MMHGELWQECERAGCHTEPVCLNCFLCARHCACPPPPTENEKAAPTATLAARETPIPDPRFAEDLLTFECGGMGGERFPNPDWPELPGAQRRPSGAASQIYGTREQCLEWARILWQHTVATGRAAQAAWFHLTAMEMGWDNVQGYIHSKWVREVVGIEELVRAAREHVPTLPALRPDFLDSSLEARYAVAEKYGLAINPLQPVDPQTLAAALEAARGRRLRGHQSFAHGIEDLTDDYWVRNGVRGSGIDAQGHVWTSTYERERVDLTALAAQPVSIPIPDPADEETIKAICGRLGMGSLPWSIEAGGKYHYLFRFPDGTRRLWDGTAWHVAPEMTEPERAAGLQAFAVTEDARARHREAAQDEERLTEIRKAAKRADIREWGQFALLNSAEELDRREQRSSETVLSRIVVQDAEAAHLWELWAVRWAWGCLGEDGEADEEFEVFSDPVKARAAFERYAAL